MRKILAFVLTLSGCAVTCPPYKGFERQLAEIRREGGCEAEASFWFSRFNEGRDPETKEEQESHRSFYQQCMMIRPRSNTCGE